MCLEHMDGQDTEAVVTTNLLNLKERKTKKKPEMVSNGMIVLSMKI